MKVHTSIVDTQKNGITLTLCVDDFGIKYIDQANALHLLNALKSKYTFSMDWDGKLYCGIILN